MCIFQALPDLYQVTRGNGEKMGLDIFVGILCILALGACAWAWWMNRGDSASKNDHSNESEVKKHEKN